MRVNADIENSSVNSKSAFIPLSDRQFACQGELRAHGGRRATGWLKISYSIHLGHLVGRQAGDYNSPLRE